MKTYKAGELREDMLVVPVHELESATPSEDGREVPEVVEFHWPEYHAEGMGCGLEDRGIRDRYEAMQHGWDCAIDRCTEAIPDEPLMTVAQHSRIVAAKDAEIAKFKEANRELGESNARRRNKIVELMQKLDAQPASQVGGDERATAIAQFAETLPMTSESAAGGNTYDQELRRYYLLGWEDRAALAPAAVVMPEREEWSDLRAQGYNNALDRVARLNRRAIPLELLERIAERKGQACGALMDYVEELRALLGKEDGGQ